MTLRIKSSHLATYWKVYFQYEVFGALLMIILVHPSLEIIHRLRSDVGLDASWRALAVQPILNAFSDTMWPMTLSLGVLGMGVGLAFSILHLRMVSKPFSNGVVPQNAAGLNTLIAKGESEHLEFKSSLRWDRKLGKVNKALEAVIAKTIAGMMNHRGGILLIGVEDDGNIVGIADDWNTLKHKNWDGFEQRIIALIASQIGGQHTNFIRCTRMNIGEQVVGVIQIAAGGQAVFCKDGNLQRYYLRAGNTTRELDTYEAIAHVEEKRKQR